MQTFHHPLSPEEESYYLQKAKAGDLSARNILVEYNLRLVAHIVKKYQTGNRSTEDLISIGTIGLIKAINTYDTDKGSKLVTYAGRSARKCARFPYMNQSALTGKEMRSV
mgnify:CR=1 FL=1